MLRRESKYAKDELRPHSVCVALSNARVVGACAPCYASWEVEGRVVLITLRLVGVCSG